MLTWNEGSDSLTVAFCKNSRHHAALIFLRPRDDAKMLYSAADFYSKRLKFCFHFKSSKNLIISSCLYLSAQKD